MGDERSSYYMVYDFNFENLKRTSSNAMMVDPTTNVVLSDISLSMTNINSSFCSGSKLEIKKWLVLKLTTVTKKVIFLKKKLKNFQEMFNGNS